MNETTVQLQDLASVIRSKNAGPFILTIDVFFKSREIFKKVQNSGSITRERIAHLYQIDIKDVLEITFYDPATALKISLKRWKSSAAPGDTDVFGSQQHVPIMMFDLKLAG
ncbi:MAG: DUF4387 domain-containing protein [Deltaproteobacteria bacterium]|nr:DUF4387 domain-containing protein [Deltaproteobacteria bacterium]